MGTQFLRYCCKNVYVSLLLAALLAGCTTNLSPFKQNKALPLPTYHSAAEYLKAANEAPPLEALIYQLRAAELYIQQGKIQEAQQVLRDANARPIDRSVHKTLLTARLALLHKQDAKARSLIKSALNTLSSQYKGSSPLAFRTSPSNLRIALLLPSKGPHAEAAKTVRDGFLAAYYQNQTRQQRSSEPTVKIYDTGDGSDVRQAYHQAIADEANFIVGPLTKPEVQALAQAKLEVPVLALNTISEDSSLPGELYQFGLMPEDEVIALGNQALRQGRQAALVLAPQNEWGHRLTNTFKQFWESHGRSVVDIRFFKSNQDLEEKIHSLLKVKEQGRRQDVDMIFMAASPEIARQIKPLLNFYYAENLPVYATASIYAGVPAPQRDQDLNGVHFCDMPWVLQPSTEIQEAHQSLEKLSPHGASQSPRFFALGMDAYQLANQLGKSNHLPSYGLSGYTGHLYLNNYQRIERGLVCAKFEQGIPVPD